MLAASHCLGKALATLLRVLCKPGRSERSQRTNRRACESSDSGHVSIVHDASRLVLVRSGPRRRPCGGAARAVVQPGDDPTDVLQDVSPNSRSCVSCVTFSAVLRRLTKSRLTKSCW